MAANNPSQTSSIASRLFMLAQGFHEKWGTSDPNQVTMTGAVYQPTQVFDWFVPDNPGDSNLVETLLARMVGATPDVEAIPVHATNMLAVAYPSLTDGLKEQMRMRGAELREVKLPSQLEESLLLMPPRVFSSLHLSIVHATLFILMFKKVTQVSYDNFINRRIAALRAVVGVPYTDNIALKIFTPEHAITFQSNLGMGMKKLVLNHVLSYVAMQYAAKIVAWSDMTAFSFIVDELVRTNSPVLANLKVHNEVLALSRAVEAAFASPYPQFFKFLAPIVQSGLVEQNNFPILAAVAWKLRKDRDPTLHQFIGGTNVNMELVTQLADLHKSFIRDRRVISTG